MMPIMNTRLVMMSAPMARLMMKKVTPRKMAIDDTSFRERGRERWREKEREREKESEFIDRQRDREGGRARDRDREKALQGD